MAQVQHEQYDKLIYDPVFKKAVQAMGNDAYQKITDVQGEMMTR